LKDLGGGQGLVKAKMHFQVIRDFGLFVKKEIKEKNIIILIIYKIKNLV